MSIIPLNCPLCGGECTVNSEHDAGVCQHCGREFIIKDAIAQNYINYVANINAQNVNIFNQRDFVIRGGVLEKYQGEIQNVIIPEGVRKIGDNAFKSLKITSVEIPNTVNIIGTSAFSNCDELVKINLPDSVTEIGFAAFQGCKKLKRISIPGKLTEIDGSTFQWCFQLEEITLPDGITEIGRDAFSYCEALKEIKIPTHVSYISPYAFYNCSSLSKVILHSCINDICYSAFANCESLKMISIPDGVSLSENSFEQCHNLENVNINIDAVTCYCYDGDNIEHRTFVYSAFNETPFGNKLKPKEIEIIKMKRRADKRCTFCGGELKGFVSKKCIKCHAPSHYNPDEIRFDGPLPIDIFKKFD